jgi:hypothetical protein
MAWAFPRLPPTRECRHVWRRASLASAAAPSTVSTGKTCFVTVAHLRNKGSEAQTANPDGRRLVAGFGVSNSSLLVLPRYSRRSLIDWLHG